MRVITILLALGIICIAAGPMVLIAISIWIYDGRPILFLQTRVGRNMTPFRIYKFRTMRNGTDFTATLTLGRDPRITPLGAWLRRLHLDELPQLWNILRGDMNFIGPRPEVPEFIDPANPLHRRVYAVRPGLIDSGTLRWLDEAEVLARASDWKAYYREVILPDKLQCSLEDIEAKSLWRDCRLFVGGLGKIASRVTPRHSRNS